MERDRKRRKPVTRDLSAARVIKDDRKAHPEKYAEEEVKFNSGLMPGNSYRCGGCGEGFMIPPGYPLQCPHCQSTNLTPHAESIVR